MNTLKSFVQNVMILLGFVLFIEDVSIWIQIVGGAIFLGGFNWKITQAIREHDAKSAAASRGEVTP